MDHATTIKTIASAVQGQPGVKALFLGGSHANGRADEYSDLDFVLVTEDGVSDAHAAMWKVAVAQTGEIVLWWDRNTVPVLINAITDDWTRTDLLILSPEGVKRYAQSTLKPVFDPENLYSDLPETPAAIAPDPARFLYQVQEFIRVPGLLHLVVGRAEYINGVSGIFHLRNLLVDLMIAETDAPDRDGVLHLNRLITQAQKDELLALPPPVPDRDALIAAHQSYAAAYLPSARRHAQDLGVAWPEAFEAATLARLFEAAGIERPYQAPKGSLQ